MECDVLGPVSENYILAALRHMTEYIGTTAISKPNEFQLIYIFQSKYLVVSRPKGIKRKDVCTTTTN